MPVTAFQGGEGLLPAYQRLVREKVIPYQYQVLEDKLEGVEKSHALENLRLAAQKNRGEALSGEFYGMVFQDSDVAKWLEAAAYSLGQCPDPALEREVDSVVELLAQVQQEDGYLNSYFTVKEPERKWTNLQEAHELYCAGHLMEAACAYYEATEGSPFEDYGEKRRLHLPPFHGGVPPGLLRPPGGGAGAAAAVPGQPHL